MMKWSLTILALLATTLPAFAELPTGVKQIVLRPVSGDAVNIGQVTFSGVGETRAFAISMADGLFKDHFLSMRPFKCLEGVTKFYCHLPYPYAVKGVISEGDLTDLEYALLFVQKEPQAYGINLWYGVYYKMALQTGGAISGALHDVDMDLLASPPAAGEMRPIKHSDIAASPPDANWLPTLTIE
jgi:hypothetical protein